MFDSIASPTDTNRIAKSNGIHELGFVAEDSISFGIVLKDFLPASLRRGGLWQEKRKMRRNR